MENSTSAIQELVEFYFSECNFRRDKFLQKAAAANADGFIPIETLLTFNRLKALTTKVESVVEAVELSKKVVLNESKTSLKRADPLPENDDSATRTVIVGGLGRTRPNRSELEKVFAEFGKIMYVGFLSTKRQGERCFSGAAFVEFEKVSEAQLAAEKIGLVVESRSVFVMIREAYEKLSFAQKKRVDSGCHPQPKFFLDISNIPSGMSFRDIRKGIEGCWEKQERPFMTTPDKKSSVITEVFLGFVSKEAAESVLKELQATKVALKDQELKTELMTEQQVEERIPSDDGQGQTTAIIQISNVPDSVTRQDIIQHMGELWSSAKEKRWFDFHNVRGQLHIQGNALANAVLSHFENNPLKFEDDSVAKVERISIETLQNQEVAFKKGLIVRISDIGDKTYSREELREAFDKVIEAQDSVAYVETNPTDIYIRFRNPEFAAKAIEAAKTETGVVLQDEKLKTVAVLEGTEEVEYWTKVQKLRQERNAPNKRKIGGGRGGNFRNQRRRRN